MDSNLGLSTTVKCFNHLATWVAPIGHLGYPYWPLGLPLPATWVTPIGHLGYPYWPLGSPLLATWVTPIGHLDRPYPAVPSLQAHRNGLGMRLIAIQLWQTLFRHFSDTLCLVLPNETQSAHSSNSPLERILPHFANDEVYPGPQTFMHRTVKRAYCSEI